MTEIQGNHASESFGRELRSFFVLCLLNLVFGALVMAFGLQFIVTAALAAGKSGTFGILPFLQVVAGGAAAVIGFRWITSSAKILKGVNRIRREFRAVGGFRAGGPRAEPVSGEALTGLILRMMAHYRENQETIRRMNLISTLGGCIFLALGLVNIINGMQAWYSPPGSFNLAVLLAPFLAGAINLAIGIVSLACSAGFREYTRAWELRLLEAEHSGEVLKQSMEQG